MNLKIEIEIAFQDSTDTLEEMLVDIADILRKYNYGNENDEEAYIKSYIRVKKMDDDEVILIVIPVQDENTEEKEIV